MAGSNEERTATVQLSRDNLNAPRVTSGLRNLLVMKTTGSEFVGFPRDQYTTLKEAKDRIFKTTITAEWSYVCPNNQVDYSVVHQRVRDIIQDVFANTHSKAVQQTVWDMGRQIIAKIDAIERVHFTLPNQHNWLFDMTPFGLDNCNEVFVPQSDPQGYIQGTVTRQSESRKAAAL